MEKKADFVQWHYQGVTAVMTWDDYQTYKHTFLHNGDGTIYGINWQAGPVPRIATFSDRVDTPEAVYFTGPKALLEQLLKYRSVIQLPLYVPFSNRRSLEEFGTFGGQMERWLRLNLDGAIAMFGLRFPEAPEVVDIADCGPVSEHRGPLSGGLRGVRVAPLTATAGMRPRPADFRGDTTGLH